MASANICSVMQRVEELVEDINECTKMLEPYRVRHGLKSSTRAELSKIQIRKAMLIAEVKMLVKDVPEVPESVLKIYY